MTQTNRKLKNLNENKEQLKRYFALKNHYHGKIH